MRHLRITLGNCLSPVYVANKVWRSEQKQFVFILMICMYCLGVVVACVSGVTEWYNMSIIVRLGCYNIYRLINGHFHIGLVIIPRPPYWPETQSRVNMGRGMITRPIWKCRCIKLFITYFRHLEKRHPYWPETKSRPILAQAIWASIWK